MNAPHISVPSTDAASVPDTLARILADKAREVAERMEITPQAEIERRAASAPPLRARACPAWRCGVTDSID